ncbi:MAG: flagellar motor protein [Solidesulfovibrio magneticus str. Maddingley MBC34]|uniref:Flagellar motor protein n=1 Tax=Solidesulfovibrio magneticus str. Maddingley MBC34 TaxID=1206767 RepID=K6H9N8_9BACT|nr:MAG: flagellar motor protein [Solidesulfovibrio magneticus str. Maddingley MBC34]
MFKLSDLRKRRHEEEDLWPISLADMMTLLLCFFLLIVAVSHVDLNRYERVADSMQQAMVQEKPAPKKQKDNTPPVTDKTAPPPLPFEKPQVRSKVSHTTLSREPAPLYEQPAQGPQTADASKPGEPHTGQPQEPTKAAEPAKPGEQPKGTEPAKADATAAPPPKPGEERTGPTRKSLDDIRKELSGKLDVTAGAVEVRPRDNGVELNLRGAAFFDLASAEVKPGGIALLRDIAATLAGTPYKVTVEGHTDNLPMESWLYPSNWELSSARASRVARFLIDHGVPRDHLRVEGLADTQPVAPNTDPSGRPIPENQARNRRVVILVSP